MIAQLLNRDFVLEQMRDIHGRLASGEPGTVDARRDLAPEDRRDALDALDAALSREQEGSSGQHVADAPADRRGRVPAPIDDFSFISHDPVVSLFQSAMDEYLSASENGEPVEDVEPPDDRRAGDDPPLVTDRRLEGVAPRRADGRRLFDQFSVTDARWVSSLFAMGLRKFRNRRPFPTERPVTRPIADTARVLLVGDWGSGIPRAQKVAAQMRTSLDQALAEGRECHVVHLGDVYYSGFEREYRDRFLEYWPVRKDEATKIGSWCLNGNHDMYAGGYAYFDYLLKDPRFNHWQGQFSTFRLQNRSWQIYGLDTAWDDDGLKDPQNTWVRELTGNDPQRNIMLLSHHQLFSAHEQSESRGKVLRDKLGFLLTNPRLRAWFWGHEHRCNVFAPHSGVAYGACIGHGGVPTYMNLGDADPLPAPSRYEYRKSIVKGLEKWGYMGYTVLDFRPDTIHATYIDEVGETHFEDDIS